MLFFDIGYNTILKGNSPGEKRYLGTDSSDQSSTPIPSAKNIEDPSADVDPQENIQPVANDGKENANEKAETEQPTSNEENVSEAAPLVDEWGEPIEESVNFDLNMKEANREVFDTFLYNTSNVAHSADSKLLLGALGEVVSPNFFSADYQNKSNEEKGIYFYESAFKGNSVSRITLLNEKYRSEVKESVYTVVIKYLSSYETEKMNVLIKDQKLMSVDHIE